MSSRLAPLSLVLLLATSAAAQEKTKVSNFLPFDLAVCFLEAPKVDPPITETALNGLWIMARPLVLECLADTRLYVAGKSPAFKISITVDETGYHRSIESDGLTAFGKTCLDGAVGKVTPPIAALAAGSKPVTFSEKVPEVAASQQIKFGINTFSDVAGTVRLAMPSLCSCFAPFKDGPAPAPMTLKVTVTPSPERFKQPDGGFPKPADVTVNDGPEPMKACIADKLDALPFGIKSNDQIQIRYEFDFLNSGATSSDVSALPDWLKFAQLDAMEAPLAAASQLALSKKVAAADHYNELVQKYKALTKTDPKKAHTMVNELVLSCKRMVTQDDAQIAALQKEAQLAHATLALATSLKAKDPSWANAEAAAQKATTEAETRVTKAKEFRAADEKVCPKVHAD